MAWRWRINRRRPVALGEPDLDEPGLAGPGFDEQNLESIAAA
jgi:hypothetical protein